MSSRSKIENLLQVKTQLAEKWERFAANSNSKPARVKAMRRAKSYRQQVANLSRM